MLRYFPAHFSFLFNQIGLQSSLRVVDRSLFIFILRGFTAFLKKEVQPIKHYPIRSVYETIKLIYDTVRKPAATTCKYKVCSPAILPQPDKNEAYGSYIMAGDCLVHFLPSFTTLALTSPRAVLKTVFSSDGGLSDYIILY